LKKLGAKIKQNEQGEVVKVSLRVTKITDAGLVHLKGLTKLQTLYLGGTKITGGGLLRLGDRAVGRVGVTGVMMAGWRRIRGR
jgi:hypothetical protein